MKPKLLFYFFPLVLIIFLISCSSPSTFKIDSAKNNVNETIKEEATDTETSAEIAEWLFYNYIVSVPAGVEISIAEAFLYKDKLNLTANVTTLIQLKEQMPEYIPLEITDNGPFQFCTFTFDDGSEIIFQFTQSQ